MDVSVSVEVVDVMIVTASPCVVVVVVVEKIDVGGVEMTMFVTVNTPAETVVKYPSFS